MAKNIFLLLCIKFVFSLVESTDPIVQISNGKVQGKIMRTFVNTTFYAFQGIPFAKPPIGDLRFQAPQSVDNWEGVLDGQNAQKICYQLTSKRDPNENEDCLYLHVYTPQLPSKTNQELLPVIYVIHGGAFVAGSASFDEFGPHYFIDKNIIMVNVQYRLGFLGFLSTEDLFCPGNNGLKDQKFGLEWVQKNIQHFGGDPKKVTIFGQSAGGASISYQLITPKTEDLFQAAIQHSASSLGSFALQNNPKGLAYLVGKTLNNSITEENTSTQELVKYFRTISSEKLIKANFDIFGDYLENFFTTLNGFVFSGVIEPEHDGAFLTQSAYEKFKSGNFSKVPMLIGFNSEEAYHSVTHDKQLDDRIKKFNSNPETLVPIDMHITDVPSMKEVGENIREIYLQGKSWSNHEGSVIKYFSDSAFCRSLIKQVEFQSYYTDVYLYEFAYSGKLGYGPFPPTKVPGADVVTHCEEMHYLFHSKGSGDLNNYPKEDILTMNRMVTMWTNFIKYLNPTPKRLDLLQNVIWPKITSKDNLNYLLINDTLKVEINPKKKMMDTYKILYDLYATPPLVTY